jgi:hypothetical protein
MPKIIVNTSSIERASSSLISGQVHWLHQQFVFPDIEWWDSPVVVFTWWLDSVTGLINGSQQASMDFMEGPFSIEIVTTDGNACTLRFTRRGQRAVEIIGEEQTTLGAMLDALIHASADVLAACEQASWRSSDIDALRAALDRARSVQQTGGGAEI